MYGIRFPGFGIFIKNLKDGFSIFGLEIKYYGLFIAVGFLVAFQIVLKEAKRTGQKEDDYLDYFIRMVIPVILGARIYYIIFNSGEYFEKGKSIKDTLMDLINIRQGGLAIYGGIIAGVLVAYFYTKKRKINFILMADTTSMGLLIGQIFGRVGNFFNREAFGEYTTSKFAMDIPVEYYINQGTFNNDVANGVISQKMILNIKEYQAMNWISVHPTFLYEMIWNIILLIIIFLYRKNKKFDGELGLIYLWGYGLGRVWIEGLRTDSLMIGNTNFRVSQVIAAVCVIVSVFIIIKKRISMIKEKTN